MGNSLGGKKTTKVMKINGETMKLKTPVTVEEVIKEYPGHVLLESEAVKHYGIRAKPLQPHQNLEPKRLYFLVVLPDQPIKRDPRRVRSGINMSAKDRLESLMLSRRSVSDLSIMKPISIMMDEEEEKKGGVSSEIGGLMRVKMRLPKAELEKLMKESKNETEAAEKILDLCKAKTVTGNIGEREIANNNGGDGILLNQQQTHWNGGHGRVTREGFKAREKRVSFMPNNEGRSQIAVITS